MQTLNMVMHIIAAFRWYMLDKKTLIRKHRSKTYSWKLEKHILHLNLQNNFLYSSVLLSVLLENVIYLRVLHFTSIVIVICLLKSCRLLCIIALTCKPITPLWLMLYNEFSNSDSFSFSFFIVAAKCCFQRGTGPYLYFITLLAHRL